MRSRPTITSPSKCLCTPAAHCSSVIDGSSPGGRSWPAGTFLTLGVAAANRDPAAFERPEALDIGRKPNPHVAFGHGAHACAGMNVARMEGRIAIGRVVVRCPRLALAGAPERDPRVRFRGFRRLPVALG